MKRLSKKSLTYLHILHVIWQLVDYYSNLFLIDAGECPCDIPVRIMEYEGKTFLRFTFNALPEKQEKYSVFDIAELMQEYLQYCLLPEQTFLCPYKGGTSLYDTVEPLFIDSVIAFDGFYWIDVLWINNPISFKYCNEQRGLFRKELL